MKFDTTVHLFINDPHTRIFCGINQKEAGTIMGARGINTTNSKYFENHNICPECMKTVALRELAAKL